MKPLFPLVASLVFVACGGAPPLAPQHGPGHPHGPGDHHHDHAHEGERHAHGHADGHHAGHHGGHEKGHHKKLGPELHAFHEALGPVWHTAPGEERAKKACASAAQLKEKGAATKDADLATSIDGLQKACGDAKLVGVEEALGKVHQRFHVLADGPKP